MDKKETKGVVVSLSDVKQKIQEEHRMEENQSRETLQRAVEAFTDIMENGLGFVAIAFDVDRTPIIFHAGELDIAQALGSLELVKFELMTSTPTIMEQEDF